MVMIKGIEIEFGATTTKLDQALKKVNLEANKVQRELRGVNTLLRMNPKSPALVAQKTKLLARSVDEAKRKQNELNLAMQRANKEKVDKQSAAYRKLERELEVTNIKLKQLEKEQLRWLASQSKIGRMSTAMTNFGAKCSAAANKMKYLSLAAAGIGAAALKVTMDFDEGMSKVQAITGATGDELESLRQKAKDLGATTKFSATQATEAMNYMAMAGWKSEDMLSGLDGVMNLAAASGEDLATTSDIVTDALTAFNLTAADSNHFADVLAAASANANTNVRMMGETFKYAAPIAGSMGYSIEDTAEAIGLMANASVKGSRGGTALRRIMTSLTKDFTLSGKRLGEVTIKTTNADGSMRSFGAIIKDTRKAFSKLSESEKTTAASALVGQNAMGGFLALMNASPKDVKKLEDALANADGAAKSMADTMLDNTKGSITILKSTLESAGIAIGETLAPMLTKVVEGIRGLVEKFNNLSPATKDMIAKMVLFTAAGYPMLKLVGGLATGMGALLKPVSLLVTKMGMAGGTTGKFATLLAKVPGPAKLAVGAVGALALAVKAHQDRIYGATKAYKQGKKAREDSVAQALAEAKGADRLNERLQELMEVEDKSAGQKATIKKYVELLNEKVEGLNLTYDEERDKLNKGNDAIQRRIDKMKVEAEVAAYTDAMTEAFKQRLDMENKLEEATEKLNEEQEKYNQMAANPQTAEEQLQAQNDQLKAAKERYDDAAKAVANCDEEIDKYNNKILKAQGETKGLSKSVYYGSDAFDKLMAKADKTGYKFSHDLIEGFKKGKVQVPKTVAEMKRAIKFDDLYKKARAAGVTIPDKIKNGVISGKQSLSSATSWVNRQIKNGVKPNMSSVGQNIDAGIAAGMKSNPGLSFLSGAFGPIADFIKKGIKKKFGINSPAKIMIPMGEGLTEGIAKGMVDSLGILTTAENKVVSAVVGGGTGASITGYNGAVYSNSMGNASFGSGGNVITNNITVSGAGNPEQYAAALARQIKLQLRTV